MVSDSIVSLRRTYYVSILFNSILFYFGLFCSVLYCSILFYLFYFVSILFYLITLEGRRGTVDEFATIPFHLVLFSAALG